MTNNLEVEGTTVVSSEEINAENLSIGGNINQYYYGNDRTRLVPVQFSYADDTFLPPNYARSLLQLIDEKKVLLISGDQLIGKSDLVRYLARMLQSTRFPELEIVELLRENENQDKRTSISDILHNEHCSHKIVLLYDIHPERIDYNFERLLQQVNDRSCICIITVSASLEIWKKAGRLVNEYWYEVPRGRHYSESQLQDYFIGELRRQAPVFLENYDEEFNIDMMLSPSLSAGVIIERFTSLEQVQLFLSYYRGLKEMPGDHKLQEFASMLCQGHEQMIRSWFYQLNHREKILALSAVLFDGMLVDQYLESLHTITDTTFWETSDPQLKAVDYCNLSFLDTFFQLQAKDGEQYIVSKSIYVKQVMLELGRLEYRRHFKTALNEYHKITKLSYSVKRLNWELYGTSARRVWIRRSFTETLSLAGTIEYTLVENHLLELAASGNQYLQKIGAKAMAQWRLSGHEELLFSTLRTWQRDEEIQERIKELFERNEQKSNAQKVRAIDLIKNTAIMTLGYAAYYDQPNQLHEEIIQAMVEFSNDESRTVVQTMCNALPKFIHHHSLQLQRTLFEELMPLEDLRDAIIEGLVLAMEDYPDELAIALKNWFESCIAEASAANRRNAGTYRDNRLIVLLGVLEKIDLTEVDAFHPRELYTRLLIPLLKQEGRSIVLDKVIILLARVQSYDYRLAATHAAETIGHMNQSMRIHLVVNWGAIYRIQRSELDGTEFYERDGENYPVWTGAQSRPLTSIEKALYEWMEGHEVQRRFATLVFLEMMRSYDRFERIELQRQALAQQQELLRSQQQVRTPILRHVPTVPAGAGVSLHILLRIRIFFYFLFSSNENKYLLKDTILLFLTVHRYSSDDLDMLINRWQYSEQRGLTSKLAKWLRRFF